MIRTNTLKGLRVTRERKVRIIANTNDTYEYIDRRCYEQPEKEMQVVQQIQMVRTNTLKELRVTRERKERLIANTNDTYEYFEGATSNQRKKGKNYNKYK